MYLYRRHARCTVLADCCPVSLMARIVVQVIIMTLRTVFVYKESNLVASPPPPPTHLWGPDSPLISLSQPIGRANTSLTVSPAHSLVLIPFFSLCWLVQLYLMFFWCVFFGRDAETSGRQSHQGPTITAASRCSPCSVVVRFVLASVPLPFFTIFQVGMWT